jgi:uncharacterized protein (UPF0548 family)
MGAEAPQAMEVVQVTDKLEPGAAAFLRAQQQLIFATEAQWQMGMTPTLSEDTMERSKGTTSDPVPTIVDDTRRQKLRAAVIEAEDAQRNYLRVLAAAANHVEKALSEYGPGRE